MSRPTTAWSDQTAFEASINPNRKFSSNQSMLGSIKSKLGRKKDGRTASIHSVSSTGSAKSHSRPHSTISDHGPTELRAATERMSINTQVAQPERSSMQNPSPATRRPPPVINEPPPAYSPAAPEPSTMLTPDFVPRAASPSPSITSTRTQEEDKYSFLGTFDTILLIDDSGSMAGRSWRETKAALTSLLPVVLAHDKDGIDIYFLNHISTDPGDLKNGIAAGGYRNVASIVEVERIFKSVRPGAGTPTGQRCRSILKPYLAKLEAEEKKGKIDDVKPLNILTITDGVPSDDVESVLINAAKKLDALDAAPHQIGIQFFQVGNEDGAAAALKELDDELSNLVDGGIRDIVDTCTWMGGRAEGEELKLTGEGILKVVLGAVVKRLDRRRCSIESRRG